MISLMLGSSSSTRRPVKIVQDRVNIERHRDSEVLPARVYERALAQDKMILGALKCAKLHGYTGEE